MSRGFRRITFDNAFEVSIFIDIASFGVFYVEHSLNKMFLSFFSLERSDKKRFSSSMTLITESVILSIEICYSWPGVVSRPGQIATRMNLSNLGMAKKTMRARKISVLHCGMSRICWGDDQVM